MEFAYEKRAMRNEPLPKGLDVADSCTYLSFRYLYLMYKGNLISKEEAIEEKRSILYNYSKTKSEVEFLEREVFKASERIKSASEEYVKKPTIENADKLYAAFYNIPENWRKEENK